jgi:hypothetical protein
MRTEEQAGGEAHPLTDLCTAVPQLRMPAANEEKKPPPEEAAPPPWSLDPMPPAICAVQKGAYAARRRVKARAWGARRPSCLG